MDVSKSLGSGTAPVTLHQGDILYCAHNDWLSGLLFFILLQPSGYPVIDIETFDGISDSWQPLPLAERTDQLSVGHSVNPVGYDYRSSGIASWGTSPYLWTRRIAQPGFPENAIPPSAYDGYWIRLTNTGTTALTIDRLLPQLYNTYVSYQDVARFLGITEPSEQADPTATLIRNQIRAAEDWLDDRTRRSWRPKLILNEHATLNVWGITLRYAPVWFVSRAILWNYNSQTLLFEGRSQDFFVSPEANSVRFNTIGLGLMPIFGKLTSSYYRQQDPFEVDYVYGDDIDTHHRAHIVKDTIIRKVATDIIEMSDWAPSLIGNAELTKPEKLKSFEDRIEKQVDQLTRIVMV